MKRRRTVWLAPVAQVIEFHAAISDALILGLAACVEGAGTGTLAMAKKVAFNRIFEERAYLRQLSRGNVSLSTKSRFPKIPFLELL
jgi:hypothetical protein